MEVRPIQSRDYETFLSWWEGHGVPPVDPFLLPKVGVVVEGIAAAWLYHDNSRPVCFLMWLVTNPDAPLFSVPKAIGLVTEALEAAARANDYGILITTTHHEGLVGLHERNGFTKIAGGITHMIKVLR